MTLRSSLLTRLAQSGQVSVTVQASNGRSMVQDTRTVRVYGNQTVRQSDRQTDTGRETVSQTNRQTDSG